MSLFSSSNSTATMTTHGLLVLDQGIKDRLRPVDRDSYFRGGFKGGFS